MLQSLASPKRKYPENAFESLGAVFFDEVDRSAAARMHKAYHKVSRCRFVFG